MEKPRSRARPPHPAALYTSRPFASNTSTCPAVARALRMSRKVSERSPTALPRSSEETPAAPARAIWIASWVASGTRLASHWWRRGW